jgi:hypothetical protein
MRKSIDDATPEEWYRASQLARKGMKMAEEQAVDQVNHPPHYVEGRKFEPWDVIDDWQLNYFAATALKYISRYERKGKPIEDLQKAIVFLEKEVERLKRRTNV